MKMAQNKYDINEKASSAYIMNLYANKGDSVNDIRFYMNVAFQMATTLVHKAANEKMDDASFGAAIVSVTNAAITMSVQLGASDKSKHQKELDDSIIFLKSKYKELYSSGSVMSDEDKAKIIIKCLEIIRMLMRNFGEFDMYLDRPGSVSI